ncbi:hypothetical protein HYALB_00011368 [Hymenoscyphus albidus]|uniref:Uncharacterized protein n=1 Tax=Hymenoscyphus albidus TaxID=595503 RepID=A0A9N9PWC2_9HELO|nr:hypothetical protein HYALB_00011368 [Hymenoscyphus albidus]
MPHSNSNSNNYRSPAPHRQISQPFNYSGPVARPRLFTDGYKDTGETGTSPGRGMGGGGDGFESFSTVIGTGNFVNGNANMNANTAAIRLQNEEQQTMEERVELP